MYPPETVERVLLMVRCHQSWQQITKLTGVKRETIRRWIRDANMPLRTRRAEKVSQPKPVPKSHVKLQSAKPSPPAGTIGWCPQCTCLINTKICLLCGTKAQKAPSWHGQRKRPGLPDREPTHLVDYHRCGRVKLTD